MLDWLELLSEFSFELRYCPGILNVLPDYLSRLYPPSFYHPQRDGVPSPNLVMMKMRLDELIKYPEDQLRQFIHERFIKNLPPKADRADLLQQAHSLGHFGADALFKQLWRDGHFWPGMRREARNLVSQCKICLQYNIGKSGFHPLRSYKALLPMDQIAIDLFSMNDMSSRGVNFVLVAVDIATRYHWLIPLTDKRAVSVARALFTQIISRFGAPKVISSDNGPEFVNEMIHALGTLFGVSHCYVAPYNPRASLAESGVRLAKQMLSKLCEGRTSNWDLYLPAAEYTINFVHEGRLTKSSPAALMFGRAVPLLSNSTLPVEDAKPLTPSTLNKQAVEALEVLYPSIASLSDSSHARVATQMHDARRVDESTLPQGARVMIKDPRWTRKDMEPRYLGPYEVVSRSGNSYRLVDCSSRQLLTRIVPRDQLKIIASPLALPDPAALATELPAVSDSIRDPSDSTTPTTAVDTPVSTAVGAPDMPKSTKRSRARAKGQRTSSPSTAEYYEVQDILDFRQSPSTRAGGSTRQFLIRWKGFPKVSDNTWEPESNIPAHLIESFLSTKAPLVPASPQPRRSRRRAGPV